MSLGCMRKSLKHVKIVERVLERRKRMLMNLDDMQLGFVPRKEQCILCLF